jgi:eukaryotic translation initiation factor 2C
MLVPELDQADYADIIFIADFFGKHTLGVIRSKVDGENNEHKLSNIALKFNIKYGGNNHWLDNDKLNEALRSDRSHTIVLGADVGHPGIGASWKALMSSS